MTNSFTVAQEYAKAIFQITLNQKNQDQWKTSLVFFSKISQNNFIKSLFYQSITPEKLLHIFISIYEEIHQNKINQQLYNFINIITQNHRILLLPQILKEFTNLYYKYKQSIIMEIISARPLNYDQSCNIIKTMSQFFSKTICAIYTVNPNILAGIILKIEDIVIDGSIKKRILRLSQVLQS